MAHNDGLPRPTGRVDGSLLPMGLLLHPFQVGVAVLSVLVSTSLLVAYASPAREELSLVQVVLPPPLAWIWGAFLFMGGALVLIGVFTRSERRASMPSELSGLSLMGSAWAVYAVAITAAWAPTGFIPAAIGYVVAVCALVRVRALLISARVADRESRATTSRK